MYTDEQMELDPQFADRPTDYQLGIDDDHEAYIAAMEASNEPQTAAYQAAVDNIADEMLRAAISIQNSWNFHSGTSRYDRWDYELDLEAAIAAEVFHASHPYRLS